MNAATFAPASPGDLDRAPETEIALDLVRRGLPVAPVLVGIAALIAGTDGALSAAFAVTLVLGNFLASAFLIAGAARVSLALVMAAVLFGYLGRLAIITIAVLLVKDMGWVHVPVLGITLIATHLGLLFWETRHISASLAFPVLKPARPAHDGAPAPADT
ncbi:MAG: ATP synthase subunit I [Acidimicrobiales bacterium]